MPLRRQDSLFRLSFRSTVRPRDFRRHGRSGAAQDPAALFRGSATGRCARGAEPSGLRGRRQSAGEWAAWSREALGGKLRARTLCARRACWRSSSTGSTTLAVGCQGRADGWSDLCDTHFAQDRGFRAFYFLVAPFALRGFAERLHQFVVSRAFRCAVRGWESRSATTSPQAKRTETARFRNIIGAETPRSYRIDHLPGQKRRCRT